MKLSISISFVPQDIWVGVYWRRNHEISTDEA